MWTPKPSTRSFAAVTHPDLLTWQDACVAVETTSDLARGLALKSLGPANATVAVATNVEDFHRLFLSRIRGEDVPAGR